MPIGTAAGHPAAVLHQPQQTTRGLDRLGCDRMDEREVLDRLPHWEAESGQTMVEYGFVVMAVALIAIAAFQAFGGRVSAMVNTIQW